VNDAMKEPDKESRRIPVPNINVTPLIDVLLVLLIIFMVLTPLKPSRFKTLIPEPPDESALIHLSPRTLVVELDQHNSLKLIRGLDVVAESPAGQPGVVVARLAQEFRERAQRNEWKDGMERRTELSPVERVERIVFIRAPRAASYGEVARVIDAVKGAGAAPIGLQTDALLN
jgi:biopolymer transport protein ExbD